MHTTYKRKNLYPGLDAHWRCGHFSPKLSDFHKKGLGEVGGWGDWGALKGAIMASRVALATLNTFDTICPGCRYFQAGGF